MNELLELLKKLHLIELHISEYEYRVVFLSVIYNDGAAVTLTAETPQELTQAILRMTREVTFNRQQLQTKALTPRYY